MNERLRWPLIVACSIAILLLSRALHEDLLGQGPGLREILATLDQHDARPWGGSDVPIEEVRSDRVIVVDDGVRLVLLGALPDARVGSWISYQGRFDAGARGLRIQRYHVHHLRIHKFWISIVAALAMLFWWASRHRLVQVDGRRYLALENA